MRKFDSILIATDLDGTLVSDGRVSEENAEAIRYFQSEGGIFTFATGRFASHIRENFYDTVKPNTCAMVVNGNVLYDMNTDKSLYVCTMDKDKTEEALSYSIKNFGNTIRFINICNENEGYIYEGKLNKSPCKCVYVMENEESAIALRDNLIERYSHLFNIERSWATGVEICAANGGKGNAIEYLRKNLHPEIKTIICVGDFENDISMLKRADIGYAVQNATPETKLAADRITDVDNHHHALAWIINQIDKEGTNL